MFLKVSGPLKGHAVDHVQGTLGLYCYTVILALPGCLAAEGSLQEGDGNLENEGRMGILHGPPSAVYVDSTNVPISPVGLAPESSSIVFVGAVLSKESLT